MFLFLFYRIIEKLLKIRPESLIGFLMFYFFSKYFKIFQKLELKKYKDKRTLWGLFRFNNKSKWNLETFEENINRSVNYGKICFENSMETSIRGINLINIISKDKLTYQKNKSFFDMYLKLCKNHAILCPDLYIKRSGFRFNDESNNHRFYNLIFLQFHNFFFNKKVNFILIEEFIKKRIINDLFFDEGSSFYHFGVIDALLKTRDFFKVNSSYTFSVSFDKMLDEVSKHQNIFQKINFGDRDGTIIFNKNFKNFNTDNSEILEINNSKLYLKHNNSKYVFFRKENWTDFGTEGHVHDDFGMFCISNGVDSIMDVGISNYSIEPMYCKSKYHNFPYIKNSFEMMFKSKFVRKPNKSVYINQNQKLISLNSVHNKLILSRDIDLEKDSFIDSIKISNHLKNDINWSFCLNEKSNVSISQSLKNKHKVKTVVLIENLCYFESDYKMNVFTEKGSYFPDYGKKEECIFLNFNLNYKDLEINENNHFKLLKCQRKFDFNS